jgi:glycerol-3-phosphate dehydrogenase
MQRNKFIRDIQSQTNWDFIIIGGGASGLWCAIDAISRGYTTLLIEKGDFASVTSSKSTKLFHGGLQYLKYGHISLVKEALYERGLLAQNAASFMNVRPFLVPYYSLFEKSLYSCGMFAYDFLSGNLCLKKHRNLSRESCMEQYPNLIDQGLKGGCIYYDGQFDDARFSIALLKKFAELGGTALNYVEFTSFIKFNNKLTGLHLKDKESGEMYEAFSHHIINATGIFSDEIQNQDNPSCPKLMSLSRGSHIVVDQKFLKGNSAIVVPKTPDGRIIFMIPWLKHLLIGTTDVPVDSPKRECIAGPEEADYLLDLTKQYLSSSPKRKDILSIFSGIRPLVKSSSSKSTKSLSRSHRVLVSPSGLISIVGGKWTTGRKMAEDTIDKALNISSLRQSICKTKSLSFPPPSTPLSSPFIDHRLPLRICDIEIGIKDEMALNLVDIMARRSRSLFLNAKASIEIAPQVAKKMAEILDKDKTWIEKQMVHFLSISKGFVL